MCKSPEEQHPNLEGNPLRLPSSSLYLGDKLLWYNPSGIGHFGIGMRKGWYELWLVDQMRQGVPPEERERRFQEIMKKWMESEE